MIDAHVHLEKGDYSVEWISTKKYRHIYLQLAQALRKHSMYIEESSGLAINYGDKQLGMNADMLECMVEYNVPILTALDAHSPQNVGLYKEMDDLIQSV